MVATGARRRYALCGLSNRGLASYAWPILGARGGEQAAALGFGANDEDYSDVAELVAIVDPDADRVADFNTRLLPPGHSPVPWFAPGDFDAMVAATAPEEVIVASPDHTHVDYILAGLRRGLDVITEKPMTSTAADAARVLAAERDSSARVRVGHNFRYPARHQQIKRLILEGAIGRPLSVTLDYHVDVRHGASYFLRWNRYRAQSGGLPLTKSTHHLDLAGWWLDAVPERVFALGGRYFYGPDGAQRPTDRSGRPLPAEEVRAHDPYYQAQLGSGTFPDDATHVRTGMGGLPYNVQYPAGTDLYLYDDAIDIEDAYNALVSYQGGRQLSYTIDFSSPWEGYRITIRGTDGQIDCEHGRLPDGTPLAGQPGITYRPLFGQPRTIDPGAAAGAHDGADPQLRHDLFIGPSVDSTDLGLPATARDGALAVATGEAIWHSIELNQPVDVLPLLEGEA